ncbi:MAG: nickel/cobalt transporter [Nitrosomonas halophila]
MNLLINGRHLKKYGLWFGMLMGVGLLVLLIPWTEVPSAIAALQKQLHVRLTAHISQVEASPWRYGTSLILVSFLYGVFHAIGPGHGKAVIVGYLGTQKNEQIAHGIKISFLASMLQAIVAIVLVTSLIQLLNLSLASVKQYGANIEMASYLLVILLGAVICVRAWLFFYKQLKPKQQHTHAHAHADHGHACGCQHSYVPDAKQDIRQRGLVVLSMGLRPCTGALIVLMYAYVVQVEIFGIMATLAMGVGTGMTVAILAYLTIVFRDRLLKWIERNDRMKSGVQLFLVPGLMLFGGVLLIALGSSLLWVTQAAVPIGHPLL